MQDIQAIFDRIKQSKAEQKLIRDAYKSELANHGSYGDLKDKYEEARAHKKEIETAIKTAMTTDFVKLEALKNSIAADEEMISDIAYNKLMKGETVEILDEFGNKYDPIIIVRFEKTK